MRRPPAVENLLVALRLGLTSFGGPVAHLGYFRREYVGRRRWLGEAEFADLVALCQTLPGPTSSQVGFAVGLRRGGLAGGAASWLGFTLPSALLMLGFALGLGAVGDPAEAGWVRGTKLAAVAVVAHAVWSMGARLTPDAPRRSVAVVAAALAVLVQRPWTPLLVIALGAAWGLLQRGTAQTESTAEDAAPVATGPGRRSAVVALLVFAAVLLLPPLLVANPGDAGAAAGAARAGIFTRAGALVFGGGHVVLPLLEGDLVERAGLLDRDTFLAGYGAAQALPGPLFTFAAFAGAAGSPAAGTLGTVADGLLALLALFLPGLALTVAALPAWERLRRSATVRRALTGANAAVVGLLLAALYDPVVTSAVTGPVSFVIALGGLLLLGAWRAPSWLVVLVCALAGATTS